ncbi:MAG: hypothetical protein OXD49_05745, partial [Candidatus Poribacteria bacterium]|nr:hypothetical protein [Candidatus Poribacteria bacterium]
MLAEVREPRKKKGRRYPLKAMLGVLVVGKPLCGHKGYTTIAPWKPRSPPDSPKPWGSAPENPQKYHTRYGSSLTLLNSQL